MGEQRKTEIDDMRRLLIDQESIDSKNSFEIRLEALQAEGKKSLSHTFDRSQHTQERDPSKFRTGFN